MHTIKLEIEDDLYESLKDHGVNIQSKLKEFLSNIADDGYPAISTEEAKQRVSDAIDRYNNGTGTYLNADEYSSRINDFTSHLQMKYGNN